MAPVSSRKKGSALSETKALLEASASWKSFWVTFLTITEPVPVAHELSMRAETVFLFISRELTSWTEKSSCLTELTSSMMPLMEVKSSLAWVDWLATEVDVNILVIFDLMFSMESPLMRFKVRSLDIRATVSWSWAWPLIWIMDGVELLRLLMTSLTRLLAVWSL